jgi:EmrB/QacA subfamily drug resistance transporter
MWLSVLNVTIVNIALPDIAHDMHVDVTSVGWVVTGFLVVQATLLPVAGRAGDLFGRRRVFVTGVVILVIGSVLCALAWSAPSLIAFRILQAIGACVMSPTAYSYVGIVFPPHERGHAMGVLTGAIGFAPVVALNVAGVLMAAFSWRAVFWFSPVIGVFVIAGALVVLPELPHEGERKPFDIPGAMLAAGGLFGILIGLSKGETWGFTSSRVVGSVGLGLVALMGFLIREAHVPDPLIPPALLRLRSLVTANAAAAAGAAALFGLMVLMPFYMVRTLGFGPVTVAGAMTPIAGAFLILGPLGGRLMARVAAPRLAGIGYLVAALGAIAMGLAAPAADFPLLLPGLVMFAGGLAIAQSPIATTAISEVPNERMGVAASIPNISRYAGGAFGTALLGVIMHAALPPGVDSASPSPVVDLANGVANGFRSAALIAAAFLLVAAIITKRMPNVTTQRRPSTEHVE